MRRLALSMIVGLTLLTTVAAGGGSALSFSETKGAIKTDLSWHFGPAARVKLWDCRRLRWSRIRCDSEFTVRRPYGLCIGRFDVRRRGRSLVESLRIVRPLLGTRCRAKRGFLKAHHHLRPRP
jgi:hypothetical protein